MKGKKTGGRQKGTANKVTKMSKQLITELLTDYSDSGLMTSDFKALEPKDRMTIAEKLMQYVIPKMQSVGIEVSEDNQKTIEDTLIKLAQDNE